MAPIRAASRSTDTASNGHDVLAEDGRRIPHQLFAGSLITRRVSSKLSIRAPTVISDEQHRRRRTRRWPASHRWIGFVLADLDARVSITPNRNSNNYRADVDEHLGDGHELGAERR